MAPPRAAVVVEGYGNGAAIGAAGMVGGRGKEEGGLWNIAEREKLRFIAWNQGVALGRWNT
jgi:hypothetical protein